MNRLHGPNTRSPIRATPLVAIAVTAMLTASGCGNNHVDKATTSTTPHVAATSQVPSTSPVTDSPSSAAPENGDLSGKWSGTYRGAYSGAFNLHWKQVGSQLSGAITLSAPASTMRLTGTVHGAAITFGTVGSTAITYTGTVKSVSVMSGSYTVNGARGGQWGATRSS